MKNNLLLFGGTFNPIHNGHLITSRYMFEDLKKELNLKKITLMPNGNAPHKNNFIEARHRLEMCKLAVQEDDLFEVCDYESNKTDLSYTVDTIQYFKDKFDEIYLIIGPDTIQELPTWYKIEDIKKMCKFIVMCCSADDIPSYFRSYRPDYYIFRKIPRIDIRSTIIRDRIKLNFPIRYYVPTSVENYIKENRLYL